MNTPSFPDGIPASAPDPDKSALVFCPAAQVLAFYNQAHPAAPLKRMTAKAVEWFDRTALQNGWCETRHLPHIGRETAYAGCVLSRSPELSLWAETAENGQKLNHRERVGAVGSFVESLDPLYSDDF